MNLLRAPMFLLVLLLQSAALAASQIWANKVRSVLTTVGIVIGIASVTAVIAALTGLKASVLAEFETFGTNKIFILPERPQRGPYRTATWSTIRFRPEHFDDLLAHCPSVSHLTRVTNFVRPVSYGVFSDEMVQVIGIEPDWHKVENRSVVLGRPFSMIDNDRALPVCLVNRKVQDKLGLDRDCTGQSIMIGQRRFLIVGVVESRSESSMFGENQSGLEVLIPFNTARRMLGPNSFFMAIAASRTPEVSEEARAEIAFYLRRVRGIKPGEADTFRVEAVERFVQQFRQVATTITLVAAGIVAISLVVGGVGIMNIMLVSVSERTREIGLRKAVGARPSAIMLQFLVEAVMLCCLGGALGLAAGQVLTTALAAIPNARLEQAQIPGWAIALAFGFSATVGLIFGMFPAIKAARLDPIDALRHE